MEGSGLSKGHVQDHHDQEAGHDAEGAPMGLMVVALSLIHISEPTRRS